MERFKNIAQLMGRGDAVADIGADHAKLILYLMAQGLCTRGIATELPDGPYQRVKQAVSQSPWSEQVEVRQGDGLQVLQAGEVDNVVIAGLGGETMVAMLSFDLGKSASFKNYVFQPMSRSGVLRRFLAANGWPVIQEKVVKDRGYFYSIIQAEPGYIPYELNLLELEIGVKILDDPGPLGKEYLQYSLNRYKKIFKNLQITCNPEGIDWIGHYQILINMLEVKLHAPG